MKKFKCEYCDSSFGKETSLVRHLSRKHKIKKREYIVKTYYNGRAPLCNCNCGKELNFYKGKFHQYLRGHAANVQEVRDKMVTAGRLAAASVKCREKNSAAVKEKWAEKEYREKMLNMRNDKGSLYNTKRHKTLKKVWSCPKRRKHLSDLKKDLWSNNEWASKQRDIFKTVAYRAKVSEATKIALDNDKYREFASQHAIRLQQEGTISPNNSKCEFKHNPFSGVEEYMHSSWESVFLDANIKRNNPVTKNHGIVIRYTAEDGTKRSYIPDFLGINDKLLYEIKGRETTNDLLKYEAAMRYCKANGLTFTIIKHTHIKKEKEFINK